MQLDLRDDDAAVPDGITGVATTSRRQRCRLSMLGWGGSKLTI
jgi:hypothetical protein